MKDQLPKLMKSFISILSFFIILIIQVFIITTLAKLNVIYRQEKKNILVITKKLPFTTILTTAIIKVIFKIFSVSIMIHLIKYYLVSIQSKVTPK